MVTLIQPVVTIKKGVYMRVKELKEIEMNNISGGAITSPLINAVSKLMTTLYELGEKTGSSIRRLVSGKYCKAN